MKEISLNGQSHDIVKENVEKLKQLFPEIVTEENIDFDKLKAVLGKYIEKEDESYRFTWYGKRDAFRKSQIPSTGTLRPCIEDSKDWDTTQNLYIEGDNLEVLKLLQKSYSNKIKMIYIDPPYNKDRDFIYPDKWSDSIKEYKKITGQIDEDGNVTSSDTEDEGGRHTKWLNMMYPRLRLARNLLKDEGVMFISIDDEEVANLKKLCDEVFGEENFIDILKWKRKKQPSFLAKHTAKVMEYILVYSKDASKLEKLSLENLSDATKKVINISNQESSRIFEKGVRVKIGDSGVIPAGRYKIRTMEVEYLSDVIYEDGITTNEVEVISQFSVSQDKINEYIDNNLLFITVNKGLRRDVSEEEKSSRKSITDLLLSEFGDNQDSDNEFKELFGEKYFDYTKPTALLGNLIKCNYTENEFILDFFSGSSTTAHAVMKINSEDCGNRKCISVQLPENLDELLAKADSTTKPTLENAINFLDSINKPHSLAELGKERIRRAGEKIKAELQEKYDAYQQRQRSLLDDEEEPPMNPNDLDIGFKVFKLDDSNLRKWSVDVGEDFYKESKETQNAILAEMLGIEVDNFVRGRSELDVVYEIMLKYGLDLTYPIETYDFDGTNIYSIGYGGLIVCLDTDIRAELADRIVELIKELEPSMVRVAVRDLSFPTDSDKTNFKETLRNGVYAYFESSDDKADKQNQFKFITI
jgi:adenine-specific DNA-methyltransferase